MNARRGLRPVSGRGPGLPDPRILEREARLRRAWDFLVGPALADRTRLLSFRHGVIAMGTWDLGRLPSLRQAAQATWPQVQARLAAALRLHAERIEVLPCDPPEPEKRASTAPSRPTTFDELLDALQRPRRVL